MSTLLADNPPEVGNRKPPKPAAVPPSPREGQTALMVYVESALSDALDAFIASHEYKPSKKAVIEQILRKHLTETGFWPPPKSK